MTKNFDCLIFHLNIIEFKIKINILNNSIMLYKLFINYLKYKLLSNFSLSIAMIKNRRKKIIETILKSVKLSKR